MRQSKSKSYTISDIAKACGVSVASVSKYVKRNELKPIAIGKNNSKYFSDAVYQEIKSYYSDKVKKNRQEASSNHGPASKDDVIRELRARIDDLIATNELLRKELAVKNQQIESAIQIANQAQQLDLTTHNQKALPSETVKTNDETVKEHGFWWKLTH